MNDDGEIFVREWHAVECSEFERLIVRDLECPECHGVVLASGALCPACGRYASEGDD